MLASRIQMSEIPHRKSLAPVFWSSLTFATEHPSKGPSPGGLIPKPKGIAPEVSKCPVQCPMPRQTLQSPAGRPLLGGSWVVISGVISRVTNTYNPLITTHEPPSKVEGHKWDFPKIRVPYCGGPYNKDPAI